MKARFFICLSILFFHFQVFFQSELVLSEIDRIRIAEAFRIGEALRKEIWTNWDQTPFSTEAGNLFKKAESELKNVDLAKNERVAFYPFGAFEGFLLDRINPKWRESYFKKKFALEAVYTDTLPAR